SCTQPASAGARRRSAVRRSVCTSGSAFSWMTSDAEVWRRYRSRTPSRAPASARKRPTSAVISQKPSPRVSTLRVAVATRSGAVTVAAERRARSGGAAAIALPLPVHIALDALHHLDEPAPQLLHEAHHPVKIGVVGQLQFGLRLAAVLGRSRDGAAGDQLLLEAGILALQPGNLVLERGALVRHGFARPPGCPLAAGRDLAG